MSELSKAVNRFRADILRREREAANQLVRQYGLILVSLNNQLEVLYREIANLQADQKDISTSKIFRATRLESLLVQSFHQFDDFARSAEQTIVSQQFDAALRASTAAREVIVAALGPLPPGYAPAESFLKFAPLNVREFIGRYSEGSPIRELVKTIAPRAVKEFQDVIVQNLVQGNGLRSIRGEVAKVLDVPLSRSLTIVRTETLGAVREASIESYRENEDVVESWVWTAARNGRTCASCLAMDGREFPLSIAFGSHPNCFPSGVVVTGPATVGVTSRWFEGDIVNIVTASGRSLSVTKNHPILTTKGWVSAGSLNESDYVISSFDAQRVGSLINPYDYQVPSLIENVSTAFCRKQSSITRVVPVAPEDFHGDGFSSQVAVIGTNRLLRSGFDSLTQEDHSKFGFSGGDSESFLLPSESPFAFGFKGVNRFSSCDMCGNNSKSMLFGSLVPSNDPVAFGLRTSPDIIFKENSLDYGSANSEELCKRLLRLTGLVRADKITDVRFSKFNGQVYNLETTQGWMLANGIVSHNCRCTPRPKTKSWEELGIDVPDRRPRIQPAEDWFKKQSDDVQLQILGRAKLERYKEGSLQLQDLIGYQYSKKWGPTRFERSLKQIDEGKAKPPKKALGIRS